MRLWISALLAITVCAPLALAQQPKYTSPPAQSSIAVDGHGLTVDYYAPSMHGRKIMGSLVPFGEVWCTGANIQTALTSEVDFQIGDLKLPKGSYSLWTLPGETVWELIVNSETGLSHLHYDAGKNIGRTQMTLRTPPAPVETLQIELKPAGSKSAQLILRWETTEVSVPLTISR